MMLTPLLLASLAQAGHGDAFLEIDNDFEGALEIYVNGRYEGTAPGDRRTVVEVKPGHRDLMLRRPESGAVLLARDLHFAKGVTSVVTYTAPRMTLRVRNTSPVPLQVDVGPGDGVWVSPYSATDLRVTAGTVQLEARVREAGHIERVTTRTIWAEPGQPLQEAVLDYTPTSHTRLSLHNEQGIRLRAVVEGVEVWLSPGERRSVAVAPGYATVRFYDTRGRLIDTDRVYASRGEKTVVKGGAPAAVVVAQAGCSRPVTVVYDDDRHERPHHGHHQEVARR